MPRQKNSGKLSLKQRRVLEGVAAGKSIRAASVEAGYSVNVADRGIASMTPTMQDAFRRLIEKAVPLEKAAQRLSEGVDAETSWFNGKEQQTAPDFRERREYLKLAAQWGAYVPKETADLIVPIQVVIDL